MRSRCCKQVASVGFGASRILTTCRQVASAGFGAWMTSRLLTTCKHVASVWLGEIDIWRRRMSAVARCQYLVAVKRRMSAVVQCQYLVTLQTYDLVVEILRETMGIGMSTAVVSFRWRRNLSKLFALVTLFVNCCRNALRRSTFACKDLESLQVALTAGHGIGVVGRHRKDGIACTAGHGTRLVGRQEIRAINRGDKDRDMSMNNERSHQVAYTAGHGIVVVGRRRRNRNACTA